MGRRLNSLLARLLIGTGVPLALFAGAIVLSLLAIRQLDDTPRQEEATWQAANAVLRARDDFNQMQLAHRAAMLLDDPDQDARIGELRASFADRLKELAGQLADEPDQMARLERVRTLANWWASQARETRESVTGAGRAAAMADGAFRARTLQTSATGQALQDVLQQLLAREDEQRRDRQSAVTSQARQIEFFVVTIALLTTAVAVAFAVWATRSIARPMQQLRTAAGDLMSGRFAMLTPDGPDEIAELIRHFNHMGLTLTNEVMELRDDTDRYLQYIGSTAPILWSTDAAGKPKGDFPTWRAYTGQSPEQIAGDGWLEAVHPDDVLGLRMAWHDALVGEEPFEADFRLRGAAGEYRHYHCRGVPIRGPDGSIREWIGACNDVTDRHREEELTREKEGALAASRAKSEFLTRMSHELRTPLNAIIGMSKMLATRRFGPLSDKQADYLQDIVNAGEHLLNLINDVLDLAKVEAGRMEFRPEAVDVEQFVAELAATLRPLAADKGLTLTVEPPPAGRLTTDPGRYRQILVNLLSNAIKYTPAGGTVQLTFTWVAACTDEAVAVGPTAAAALRADVCDTGIGIAEADLAPIWEEFRQVRAEPAGSQGTGLGLALTRRLVSLLSGCIGVSSTPGAGSTFWVVIPRLPHGMRKSSSDEIDVLAADQPVALIIEDYAPTRKLWNDWLAELNVASVEAGDGDSGRLVAQECHPDLIILDIVLPGIDGWQLLRDLRAEPHLAEVPVMIVSINDYRLPADAPEVQAYLTKPVSRETFQRQVRALVPGLPRPAGESSARIKRATAGTA
jgi:PAS domain S-box-containing protein